MDVVILNCYRLAKFYQVDPSIFLAKPCSELDRALYWTDQIQKSDEVEIAWAEKLRSG
jgi:hypothetical protein